MAFCYVAYIIELQLSVLLFISDKMCTDFVGCIVSLDCGEVLGTYQGLVSKIDESNQLVSISQAYRNGVKCDVRDITIRYSARH